MTEKTINQLAPGQKEFVLGKGETVEKLIPDKIRIDKETILLLEEIENKKIARFTLINNLWTEVAALEEEQEVSLGHVTIKVKKIEREKVTFLIQ